jgi:hypothetical protein
MSIIHVNHIESNCRARFGSLVDMSDVPDGPDRDVKFLSRALAAFSIAALTKADDATAAQAVVDEYQDDGIDAFFFDRTEHIVYLVQSKWIKNGNDSMDVGSILKFLQGVNHFLENKVSLLGPRMQKRAQDIQDALADSQANFVLAAAYTGKPALSTEAMTPINQLLGELNDDGDMVRLEVLKQKETERIT